MISRRSFLRQGGFLALGAAGFWWLRENVIWPPPRPRFVGAAASSGWLPIEPTQPRIAMLDAEVNGRPVRALLDSGAQSSVIDRGLAEQLGLPLWRIAPVIAFGVSGAPQIGRSAAIDVRLGDLSIPGLRAAALELAPVSTASQRDFSLILGQDVLRTLVADVDFPGGRISLNDPEAYAPPPDAVATPARTEGRELLVPITVEGKPLEVVLDTGASGHLALPPASAQALGLLDGRPMGRAASITFGGLSQDRVVRVDRLDFADVSFDDVPVQIYDPSRGGRSAPGLLGVGVLERFRVIIDLRQGRLSLVEGPPIARRRRRRG